VFRHDEAKKYFGVLAAAAPLGSLAGAWVVRHFVGAWGPTAILLAASAVFAAVLPVFLFMERAAKGRGAAGAKPEDAAPAAAKGILRTIVSSPFLLFLALLVGLERMVPDLTNYLYSVAAANAYAGNPAGMAAFFANVNFWTSVGSFATSSLLTGLIVRRVGVGGGLMTAGLVNLALFALFPFAPGLGLAALFFGLDGVARYSVFKTAKETTYSATNKDVIYRVKAFIEMFVYRFSRGVAGFLLLAAGWLGWGAAGAAYVGFPLALLWLYSAWRVGREYKKLDDALPPDRR
jgi:AAA family ATP:ADP antiporter